MERGLSVSQVGIIPALAGNTSSIQSATRCTWDHPRSRGEYFQHSKRDKMHLGSSPLSRGIRKQRHGRLSAERIIPALAGNTERRLRSDQSAPDHPRSRGEYMIGEKPSHARYGSSPLSRGIQCPMWCLLHQDGIIPALAGNTL